HDGAAVRLVAQQHHRFFANAGRGHGPGMLSRTNRTELDAFLHDRRPTRRQPLQQGNFETLIA
ncbi:hypothetical protein, partial [Roseateles saccharophilus]|uniref:hypothetical protein n=1 Tax=Roseateles saccharophilus TaxID=304 RepID=UPI001A9FEC41